MVDAQTDELFVYHFDGTGHTVALTNGLQQVVNRYAYGPFGRLLAKEEAVPQPFTYVGQYGVMTEPEGLYSMRARYYDAQVGRFISEDPAGFVDGPNLYAYVGGNPVGRADPTGLTNWTGVAFGLLDFTLSSAEAVGGLATMIASPATGAGTPVAFAAGFGLSAHGALGMANSGIAIRNALYDISSPGLLEASGAALGGDSASKAGRAADLFLGIRPSALASSGPESLRDVYDVASGFNTMQGYFSGMAQGK